MLRFCSPEKRLSNPFDMSGIEKTITDALNYFHSRTAFYLIYFNMQDVTLW